MSHYGQTGRMATYHTEALWHHISSALVHALLTPSCQQTVTAACILIVVYSCSHYIGVTRPDTPLADSNHCLHPPSISP